MKPKIYTASSWCNKWYETVVRDLKDAGYEVYDFRNAISTDGKNKSFDWYQIDKKWENWKTQEYLKQLYSNRYCFNAFGSDMKGMQNSDICLLILPCGRNSHIEAGYMKGLGKTLWIYMPERVEPELTYRIADDIFTDIYDILYVLKEW
jgi:hypothetical protein